MYLASCKLMLLDYMGGALSTHNRTQQSKQKFVRRIREDTSAWKNYMYRQDNIKCVYKK